MRDHRAFGHSRGVPWRLGGLAASLVAAAGLAAAASLVASAADMARYLQMMLSGGATPGGRVMSAGAVTQLPEPAVLSVLALRVMGLTAAMLAAFAPDLALVWAILGCVLCLPAPWRAWTWARLAWCRRDSKPQP